jgi:hypothetical protein
MATTKTKRYQILRVDMADDDLFALEPGQHPIIVKDRVTGKVWAGDVRVSDMPIDHLPVGSLEELGPDESVEDVEALFDSLFSNAAR